MLNEVQTAMSPTASAVKMQHVTKIYTQWQRNEKNLLKNLINPEKHIITALQDISLEIQAGEFVAYAGPNGAGKSTTMKLLAGMLVPTEGEISVLGLAPQHSRTQLMRKTGVLFGNRTELWWDHPVIQSYDWKKVVWDIPEKIYARNLAMVTDLLDLGPLLKTFARELSLGQRMRADIGMMLLHSPQLVLLDEPTLGLDVVAKRQMIEFLKKINREDGVSIVVTSHDMDDLEEMAQRILMVVGGKLAYDGSFDGLRAITGNLTHISVRTQSMQAPCLAGAALLTSEHGVHTYEIDLAHHPITKLMHTLSEVKGVQDIEIQKAPIEKVVAGLYGHWK
ncbi:ATP-binding cassette domain-containing protein [Ruminococcaceae bacterium OttesenSCG-928-N02]|nr:ATP-binding cassette domain-containing protein [Ruminococcaceae bacterium OttesenSCG-928-N02]